jgi:long-chain fatty acid transport protein
MRNISFCNFVLQFYIFLRTYFIIIESLNNLSKINTEIFSMKKNLFLIVLSLSFSSMAFAGGIVTNTNQTAHFLRNPARGASMEIDAAFENPAGLTFLSDGFHLSLSNQGAFQTRTITSTFAPFAMNNEGNTTKSYKGKTISPVIPSLQLAYKKNNFVLSAHIAIVGGGGKVTFDDGLPSFESQVAMIPVALANNGIPTTAYKMDCSMEGNSYIIGTQLNGSYKISDALSAAVGFRVSVVNSGYNGHLTNIQINPQHPVLNPSGAMVSAPVFFTNAGMAGYAASTADKQIDCSQSGWGFSPILSVNYHLDGLNLAAKYEFKSSIDIKNKTAIDNTGLFPDGAKTANDIPAFLSIGASYELSDKWNVSGGYHHFFDSDADMSGDKQQYIDGGIDEAMLGSEYKLNDKFLISAGAQYTNTKVTDAYQSDMSYSLDSYSFGMGGAVNLTSNLRLNLAYFFTIYDKWTKNSTAYNGIPLAGTDVYNRTNNDFGIGLDYNF